jgi:diacylglycerol O-acyltransferase / wax synthase
MSETASGTRMSDLEALMWRLEDDPSLSSTVANVTILDRPPDLERLRRRLHRAAQAVPRLRERVVPSLVPGLPPSWVEDPDFSVDRHLVEMELHGPPTRSALAALATRLAASPFRKDRPLWEFVVVPRVGKHHAALVQKLHHTITDGEGGMRVSLEFLDGERDAPEPPPLPPHEVEPAGQPPSLVGTVGGLVGAGARIPTGIVSQVAGLLSDPARIPAGGVAAATMARTLVTELLDTERARSPLWTQRSQDRQLEMLRAPLDPVRRSSRALGGTLNTAFVTAAAEAAGAYHRRLGAPADSLRVSMAVSTRQSASAANAFSLARFDVPTDERSVAERFAAVQAATDEARHTAGAGGGMLDVFARLSALVPTAVLARIAKGQSSTVDFATSNVRGARVPLYLAGAKILENYPVGPTLGVAFNLTLLSYCGSLDIGLHVDSAAVAEPTLLRELMEQAFADLVDAAA